MGSLPSTGKKILSLSGLEIIIALIMRIKYWNQIRINHQNYQDISEK
jgi:hypothetical protein